MDIQPASTEIISRTTAVIGDLKDLEGPLLPILHGIQDEFGYVPRDKVVVILTGSQGEPRAALAKIARDEMRNVAFSAGDTVVFIPPVAGG